ncbi:MAG: insulinase family protein, partial [Planctomycetes bacterium]|nr:insulinase family protein [Planctomycetota bacterium]
MAAFAVLLSCLAPAQDILPYPYHIDDFDNGLRLITIPTDFPDVVSVHIVVSTGSRNEVEPGKSGFAHFFEHMMFRGSENYTSAEQAAIFKQAGADRNAYTTDDYTNYHTTVTKADLETVMKLEADRFRHLKYEQKAFRTEAMAVFGEYNKNSANPVNKALEVLRDTAFDEHTYKHTTMGFLRDIRMMPRQFEYSREFFSRWYKPEYTTILVVGDTTPEQTHDLVARYWGDWKRGGYTVEIPVEPPQQGPRNCHVKWPSETLPWVWVAFRGPAFDPDSGEMPALDLLSALGFSGNSDLYRKLYVRERKVDQMFSYFPDHKDPFLLMIAARVRDPQDWAYVRDEILATCERLKSADIDEERLAAIKSNMRYGFASSLDSSEAIASALAGYIARSRTPETVNEVYAAYERVTADDVRAVAKKYFVEDSRTICTVSQEPLSEPEVTASADDDASGAILMPSSSPLINLKLRYDVGAAYDPAGKEGLA